MYISEEDDDQQDRELWRCFACPLHDTCRKSNNSFKNSCCYSYVDEETCREYVRRHLQLSGIHKEDKLNEEQANALAQGAEITLAFETYEQRVEYRAGLDAPLPREPEHPPPGRKRQRDCEEPPAPARRAGAIGAILAPSNKATGAAPQVEALGAMVGQLANALQAAAGSGGLQASNNAALATRTSAPTAQGVELVTDSMNRILESIGQATSQCISTARTLNEEGQRLRAAAVAIEQALRRG